MSGSELLLIDGRQGEGGGQVLRTSLSLSALTGRPFHIHHIRANRTRPGLRPQHLTAVRAAAAVCAAQLSGDAVDSLALEFRPGAPPQPGTYFFDVADAAAGGSAGAVTLILQTLLWPLLFSGGPSRLTLRGGTHVPMSPPWHYVRHVLQPAYARLGARFETELAAYGWYPAGGGEVTAVVQPADRLDAADWRHAPPERVDGAAVASNLPADIPQRMAGRAQNLLAAARLTVRVEPQRAAGRSTGAGLFLWTNGGGGSALGRRGLPSDKVAETAVAELLAFVDNKVAVDRHLADQLLLPLALAHGRASYTTDRLTLHTVTNAELLQQWLGVAIDIAGKQDAAAEISVTGTGFTPG